MASLLAYAEVVKRLIRAVEEELTECCPGCPLWRPANQ
jgi:hypothetical protein